MLDPQVGAERLNIMGIDGKLNQIFKKIIFTVFTRLILVKILFKLMYSSFIPYLRRKSDFQPRRDMDDESSGKADRLFVAMSLRRRKSEGHIDNYSDHVSIN